MNAEVIGAVSPVWSRITDILLERGAGIYVWDAAGERYMDFTSGIGVVNTGHCHPRVVEAVRDQAGKLIHAQINIYYHEPLLRLISALQQVVPARLDSYYFSNSGAEAVEAAVKLARHSTGRTNVIVFQGSFHGRTAQTMAMTTSKTVYRAGYQPLPAGVFVAPFPYAYRYGWEPAQTVDFCLQELDLILHTQTAPDETAAIIVEPILGEGGYVPAPPGFLPALRDLCSAHGILLIVDEVQSGCGRTGKFFAFEHHLMEPDIIIMAKGLGSGLPISGIVAPRSVMQNWQPGSHGGTYGGNAIACAAAEATLGVIIEEDLMDNAAARGIQLMSGLRSLQKRLNRLADVRGQGLMVGCEFSLPGTRIPDPLTAKAVVNHCASDGGLILLTCGAYSNTIRWIPPLVVTESQIDEGLEIFERALVAVGG